MKAKILMNARSYPTCVKMASVSIHWGPTGAFAIEASNLMLQVMEPNVLMSMSVCKDLDHVNMNVPTLGDHTHVLVPMDMS